MGVTEKDFMGTNSLNQLLTLLNTEFAKYVLAVNGKGLSTEDFTTALKSKLEGIASGAEVNVQSDWAQADTDADDFIKNKPTIDAAPTENSTNAVQSGGVFDALALKAPLASPALSGVPTAPTASAGTDTTQIATTAFVTAAIAAAMAGVTSISFQAVASYEALPATGEAGVIYLVPNSGSAPNVKDEYFWDGTGYELFGTTEFDPSNYLQDTDVVEIPAADVTTAWNSVFNPVTP